MEERGTARAVKRAPMIMELNLRKKESYHLSMESSAATNRLQSSSETSM